MPNLTLDLETRSETKVDLSLGEDLIFFFFYLYMFSGSKTVPILIEDLLFFGLHLQNCAPSLQIPGNATNCARATQLLSNKCCSGSEPLETLYPI